MRPRVLILFSDEWLAYSPTVINLFHHLRERSDVMIVAIDTGKYGRLNEAGIFYVRVPLQIARLLEALGMYGWVKALLLRRAIQIHPHDQIVAVDSIAAWSAQSLRRRFHYLSLEIRKDGFFKRLRRASIASVTIQSGERYRYLFGTATLPTHLVQNAPVYRGRPKTSRRASALVFFGNAIPKHGVWQCVEFVRQAPQWELTIKGNIPSAVRNIIDDKFDDLLTSQRLVLDSEYVAEDEVPAYLAQFYAGFCFYDRTLIDPSDFNYLSSPSGKLFNYYAAGLPVIASDMIGLTSVETFQTGVTLATLDSSSIRAALAAIRSRHEDYVENCFRAAEHFSFTKRVQPLIDALTATEKAARR